MIALLWVLFRMKLKITLFWTTRFMG